MKKSLVFLLILAVAGGIFAQEGSFSWSGAVDVNAKMDWNTHVEDKIYAVDDAMTAATVDLAYTLGGLELGMGFAAKAVDADDGWVNSASIGLSAGYTGDNYGLHAEMDLFNYGNIGWVETIPKSGVFDKYDGTGLSILSGGPTSLWGYYTFLDGGLRLDAAYKGGGNGVWAVSDIVKDEFFDGWDKLDGSAGLQVTFTGIDSLSFGFQFPFVNFDDPAGDLLEYFFTCMTVGAAYDNGSLGVSLMGSFDNNTADIYAPADKKFIVDLALGFYYQINDAMKVNFDASMEFGDELMMSLGLGFGYNADPLSAGITIKAIDLTDKHAADAFDGMALEFAANVGYTINDLLSVGLGLTFDVGLGDYYLTDPLDPSSTAGTEKLLELEIAPSINLTVAPNATIGIGYCVRLGFGDDRYKDALIQAHNITMAFHWAF